MQVDDRDELSSKRTVFLFGSDSLGRGNEELGRILANEVLIDLELQEDLPSAIVFYNSGAKLTQEGSESVEALRVLADHGVEILTDSVSLEVYGSEDTLAVGEVVDPYVIVALLSAHSGVITL